MGPGIVRQSEEVRREAHGGQVKREEYQTPDNFNLAIFECAQGGICSILDYVRRKG